MHTARNAFPSPSRTRLAGNQTVRRLVLALLLLSLAACGQKGGLYREKKPESRFTADASLLVP
ncbi:MAG: LPS translocon maturation chaperone LptM [Gammaproteobacteria bacterium]